MANTRLAMQAIQSAIQAALQTAVTEGTITVPGQTFIGWPTSTKLSDIFGKPTPQGLVSIWPLKGKSTTRYKPTLEVVTQPVPGVTASVSTDCTTLTIGGTPKAGDIVHAFFGRPADDAAYLVQANNQPANVAAGVAAAITAFARPGVTPTVNGDSVVLAGASFSKVNVGGTGTMIREIGRIQRTVQVTVWCNDPDGRLDIADVISTNIGNAQQPFLTCDDGTAMRIEFQDDPMNDDASSSYSTFKQDLFFLVEYGLTQTVTGTQVGGAQYTQTADNGASQTAYYG